jgi:hypothetical protein
MNRGLLLHFWADIDSNPTIMGMIRGLVAAGIELDVCYETRDFLLPPSFPSRGIKPFQVSSWQTCSLELDRLVAHRHRQNPYAFVIATDTQGLLVAGPLLEHLKIPLIYLSFELTFRDELETPNDIEIKKEEKRVAQKAELIIVQDEERGRLLARENGLDLKRFVFVPNAPLGPAVMTRGTWLNQRLNIAPEKKIVLHAGSFAPWTYGEELVAAAHSWDERFILVVHTRQFAEKDAFTAGLIRQCDPKSVRFSTIPLAFDDYPEMISSCDIGLVLYKNAPSKYTQKNILHIGLSSGKFSYFARHGKPVLTSDLPTYRKMFHQHDNGRCIPDVKKLGETLITLESRLDEMGKNNARFFLDQLDFAKNFPFVVGRIKQFCNSATP